MNRQDHIKKLVENGKTADLVALTERIADRARASYAAIMNNDRLSDSGRRKDLAITFANYDDELSREIKAQADRIFTIDRDDASTVFGTKGLVGDPASLTISMRDAADRVDSIGNQVELKQVLERATRTGDEVLARAVVRKAVESRYADVVNAFTAARPDLLDATERLWSQEEAKGVPFGYTAARYGLIPPGFESASASEIRAAAA